MPKWGVRECVCKYGVRRNAARDCMLPLGGAGRGWPSAVAIRGIKEWLRQGTVLCLNQRRFFCRRFYV